MSDSGSPSPLAREPNTTNRRIGVNSPIRRFSKRAVSKSLDINPSSLLSTHPLHYGSQPAPRSRDDREPGIPGRAATSPLSKSRGSLSLRGRECSQSHRAEDSRGRG